MELFTGLAGSAHRWAKHDSAICKRLVGFDVSVARATVVGTDRQSVRPTRDRPDRVRASQTESDPVRPGQARPEQARAGCDCQPGWLKASRPHPHTSLFLCRLWWYDLNDNDDGSASQRQREGQVRSERGGGSVHDIQRFGGDGGVCTVCAQLERRRENPKSKPRN